MREIQVTIGLRMQVHKRVRQRIPAPSKGLIGKDKKAPLLPLGSNGMSCQVLFRQYAEKNPKTAYPFWPAYLYVYVLHIYRSFNASNNVLV